MEETRKKAERAARKEARKNRPKREVDKRRLANGSYSMAVTGIIIAAVIIVNFIVAAIPSKFTQFDISTAKVYSIGKTTEKVLDGLTSDVTLNFVTESGQEDETTAKLLQSYAGYSDHIKVNTVDVIKQPTFVSQYTSDTVSLNSVIVVSGDKTKVVGYSEIYPTNYYYSSSEYDGEGQITSAIAYVTSESSAKMYYTEGHNEITLSDDMTDAISKANIDLEAINLLSSDIPDDCTSLLIFAPLSDFTAEEAEKVTTYLANGGHALIVSLSPALSQTETPNFDSIMEAYGVTRTGGYIEETDANNYSQAPYLLVPQNGTSSVTSDLGNENIIDSFTEGLETAESDDAAYTVTPVLTTSDTAALVQTDGSSTSGQYTLAVAVEQTLSNDSDGEADVTDSDAAGTAAESAASSAESTVSEESDTSSDASATDETDTAEETKETKILYYASPFLFDADILSSMLQAYVSLPDGNSKLFSSSLTYLTDSEVTVSIDSKSLQPVQVTVSAGVQQSLGSILMIALPAVCIVAGIVIFVRRRRQ